MALSESISKQLFKTLSGHLVAEAESVLEAASGLVSLQNVESRGVASETDHRSEEVVDWSTKLPRFTAEFRHLIRKRAAEMMADDPLITVTRMNAIARTRGLNFYNHEMSDARKYLLAFTRQPDWFHSAIEENASNEISEVTLAAIRARTQGLSLPDVLMRAKFWLNHCVKPLREGNHSKCSRRSDGFWHLSSQARREVFREILSDM